jgi:hypothetical protein
MHCSAMQVHIPVRTPLLGAGRLASMSRVAEPDNHATPPQHIDWHVVQHSISSGTFKVNGRITHFAVVWCVANGMLGSGRREE